MSWGFRMNEISFFTPLELIEYSKTIPEQKFIWGPIVEKSTGLFVGPPKSSKTTLAENFALSVAAEKDSFLSFNISKVEGNIALALLEEPIQLRAKRHLELLNTFTDDEKEKINKRLYYLKDAPHYLSSEEVWNHFITQVKELSPSILILDSLGRLTEKKISEGDTSSFVMKRLRQLSKELNLTLIVIHHCTKLYKVEFPGIDNIKGSTEVVQECDYAIGIGKINGQTCFKTIVSRYSEIQEKYITFKRENNYRLVSSDSLSEYDIITASDARYDNSGPNKILKDIEDLLNSSDEDFVRTKDIVNKTDFDERRAKEYIAKLVDQEKIHRVSHGKYTIK